jgi:hypothetical protein
MTFVVAGVAVVMIFAFALLIGVALESLLGRRMVTSMRRWDDRGPGLTA